MLTPHTILGHLGSPYLIVTPVKRRLSAIKVYLELELKLHPRINFPLYFPIIYAIIIFPAFIVKSFPYFSESAVPYLQQTGEPQVHVWACQEGY